MAIEFNGKRNVENFKIGGELPKQKEAVKQEQVAEKQVILDNKFVKELGEDLLTANVASALGVSINKSGTQIDKEFWGDALNGLQLKDITLAKDTTKGIKEMDNVFALIDMENKMAQSPFMKALNKEFDI